MKKSILLLAFVLTTLFSCSNSDDNSSQTQVSIIGKWKLLSSSTGTLSTCNLDNATFQFLANNTSVETDGHLSGSKCIQSSYNGTYTLNNNILSITQLNANGTVNSQYSYTVTELTSSSLKLKYAPNNNVILTYSKVN